MNDPEKLRTEIRDLNHALGRQTQATNRMANLAQTYKDLADERAREVAGTLRKHDGCDRIIASLNNRNEALQQRLANCTCQRNPDDQQQL